MEQKQSSKDKKEKYNLDDDTSSFSPEIEEESNDEEEEELSQKNQIKEKEKEGKKCYGEVIDVEYEDFLDVEFFYGQRDTTMKEITVKLDDKEVKVYAYIIKEIFDNVKNDEAEEKCEIEEYTLEMQNEKFNSMQHIINQQERYLNMSLDFDLKDSW